MDVSSSSGSFHSNSNASKFTFSDGYNIAALWQNGDTAKSSFSLSKDNDTLFKESIHLSGTAITKARSSMILQSELSSSGKQLVLIRYRSLLEVYFSRMLLRSLQMIRIRPAQYARKGIFCSLTTMEQHQSLVT